MYIHQDKKWPNFTWNNSQIQPILGKVRYQQGLLLGRMFSLGFNLQEEAVLENITLDVLKSSEIEGENLNREQVRSSVARRLGMEIGGLPPTDRNVEGVVEMMLDATQNYQAALTPERLFGWSAALFPTGYSGMYKITVAQWRKDETGPMQVVSGAFGREKVHFEAPKAVLLEKEMQAFLTWLNSTNLALDPIIKAAIAHLWLITIHPFEDGNGRIARAVTDMLLARADGSNLRFYSMSAQIKLKRNEYYNLLEKTQRGDLDISDWLIWFLNCLGAALANSSQLVEKVLTKARFWEKHATTTLNDRQLTTINRLLDNFYGKLNSSKWATLNKCSTDTALRDIQDLIKKNILVRENEGGRSTSYRLID